MNIEYEIVRSNRRTLCVTVKDGKVVVRAPFRTSIVQIQRFVQQKTDWILKHLNDNPDSDDLVALKKIYVKGRLVPLTIGNENSISGNGVTVRAVSCLKTLYISTFGDEFLKTFKEISDASGLKAKSVSFKAYKSRWGCCDSKGSIIFNYKLLMLPTDLWRCVIVHELCHTLLMDHSKNFHALAKSVMPDYENVHKGLRTYACVCRLYS